MRFDVRNIFLVFVVSVTIAACDLGQEPSTNGAPTKPTYSEHIAPLLDAHCTACHQPGGIAPFSLLDYEDATAFSKIVAHQVQTRQMPPFNVNNDGRCRSFAPARWLSDTEIATFVNWDNTGNHIGNGTTVSTPAKQLVLADADVTVHTPKFEPTQVPDHYRCFVMDPQLTSDTFFTGVQVRPGAPEIAHHMLLFSLDTTDAIEVVEGYDADDPGPGFDCFSFATNAALFTGGARLIGVWAPGVSANRLPEGTGIRLVSGTRLVAQMHYNTLNGTTTDSSAVDLLLSDTVAREGAVAMLDDFDLVLPPGHSQVTYTSEFDFKNPFVRILFPVPAEGVEVLGVFPHMHERGVTQKLSYIDGVSETCLYDVDRWDFHWQEFFYYADGHTPRINTDGKLRLECSYNTMGLDGPLYWGEGTKDEMCMTFLYYVQ